MAPTIEWIAPDIGFTPDAAASFRRLTARLGRRPDVNSTYRDWDLQMSMYLNWKAYEEGRGPWPGHSRAIHPSLSRHTSGLALDSDDWMTPGFNELAAEYGWIRTAANDPTERHHFEYQSWNDQHRNEPAPSGEDEDMTPEQDRRLSALYQALFGAVNVPPTENPTGKITWSKPFGEAPGEAYYGIFDVLLHNQQLIAQLAGKPVVTAEQVKEIAKAVSSAVGQPVVSIDYSAIAKSVNDDAAARMKS